MKSPLAQRGSGAFTLVELMVVIAIIGILAALLLPAVNASKRRAQRIWCISDLKQTGVGAHTFANDHSGKFPTSVSTNDGGSLEFVMASEQAKQPLYIAFQSFRPLASELGTAQLFACPADLERWPATNLSKFDNRNLSYVMGVKADPSIPDAILAADRNVPGYKDPGREYGYLPDTTVPPKFWHWGPGLHVRKGNMLFSDGHVDESYDAIVPSEETVKEDLVIPLVPGLPPGNPGTNPPAGPAASTMPPANIQPNRPPGTANSNNKPFHKDQTAPAAPDNPTAATPSPVPVPSSASNGGAIASVGPDVLMSPANRHLARVLRHTFFWGYLLLLLLLLLYLAYKLWRRAQQKEAERQRAMLEQADQEWREQA